MTDRAIKLYGTAQPTPAAIALRAGPVTATLENGQLRWIQLGATEIIRGIAFLVRDRNWGTPDPAISNLVVEQAGDGFRVGFDAVCRTAEGELPWRADIEGRADGSIRFSGTARPARDFLTCRTGFVILHPLDGVVGRPMEITHVDGSVERTRAPELIEPEQCFFHIRAMTHEPVPGVRVTIRMEGDAWETEDQRNWTDASFKTYVRPLALPWPYTIEGGSEVRQSVTLTFAGRLSTAAPGARRDVAVTLGAGAGGRMPQIGLGVLPEDAVASVDEAALIKRAGPQFLNCRIDVGAGHGAAEMTLYRQLAERTGAAIILEVIIPGKEAPAAELAQTAEAARTAGLQPQGVVVTPAVDLKSYPPGAARPAAPPDEAIIAAARAAFPGVRIGGGMLSFFTELNRKRPPAALLDFVTHASSALVHAADDRSVMETLETLPHIIRSTGAMIGGKPYRIGPSAIGMSFNPYGATTAPNPNNERVPMARVEPRHRALFGAAWHLGFVAEAARGGVEAVALAAPVGPFGIAHARTGDTQPYFDALGGPAVYPPYHVLSGLARAAGAERLEVRASDPTHVQCLAYRDGAGVVLWLANLRETPQPVTLASMPAGRAAIWQLDEDGFEAAAQDPGFGEQERDSDASTITLGAFAVARLRFRA